MVGKEFSRLYCVLKRPLDLFFGSSCNLGSFRRKRSIYPIRLNKVFTAMTGNATSFDEIFVASPPSFVELLLCTTFSGTMGQY